MKLLVFFCLTLILGTDSVSAQFDLFGGMFKAVADVMTQTMNMGMTMVKSSIDLLPFKSAIKMAEEAMSAVQDYPTKMLDIFQQGASMATNAAGGVANAAGGMVNAAGGMANAAGGMAGGLAGGMVNAAGEMTNAAGGMANAAGGMAGGLAGGMVNAAGEMANAAGGMANAAGGMAGGLAGGMANPSAMLFQQAASQVMQMKEANAPKEDYVNLMKKMKEAMA